MHCPPTADAMAASLAAVKMCQEVAGEMIEESNYELDSARSSIDAVVWGGREVATSDPTTRYARLEDVEPFGGAIAEDTEDTIETGTEVMRPFLSAVGCCGPCYG